MRILLTGGSACGKSTYAERLATAANGPVCYLATMLPYGGEGAQRILRHRAMRQGKGFVTVERYTDLRGLSVDAPYGAILLECLCNLTANEMFSPDGAGAGAYQAILDGVGRLEALCETLIVVTNDVGSDGGGYDASTMRYVETLGRLNAALAARFDCVAELIAGIPLVRKGALPI